MATNTHWIEHATETFVACQKSLTPQCISISCGAAWSLDIEDATVRRYARETSAGDGTDVTGEWIEALISTDQLAGNSLDQGATIILGDRPYALASADGTLPVWSPNDSYHCACSLFWTQSQPARR